MKRLIFGLVFIALGFGTIMYYSRMENEQEDSFTLQMYKTYEDQTRDNEVRQLVNKAKTLADLEYAEQGMRYLPAADQAKIAPYISLKKSAMLFNEAEDYLKRAVEIENSASVPPEPPPMSPAQTADDPEAVAAPQQAPQPRVFHPLTTANLEKAFALYEKARKESEKLKDGGDSDFNYHMNYLKGEIYYRILELMADQESAQEIFNQALTYYKYALRNRGNDINTIVNIEIMIKNQSGLVGNAGNPQARKKQMLNSKKYGIGKSSGN